MKAVLLSFVFISAAIAQSTFPPASNGGGTGDVTAAAVFGNDNRLLRSDGSGKGAQASGWSLVDDNTLSCPGCVFNTDDGVSITQIDMRGGTPGSNPAAGTWRYHLDGSGRPRVRDSAGATTVIVRVTGTPTVGDCGRFSAVDAIESFPCPGGGSAATLGHCVISFSCTEVIATSRPTVWGTGVRMKRVTISGSLPLTRIGGYFSLGTSVTYAVYADNAGEPGTKIANSDGQIASIAAGAFYSAPWKAGGGAGPTLAPGTYWIGVAFDNAATLFWTWDGAFGNSSWLLGANSTKPGYVGCSEVTTGSGASYTMPATCGTATAVTSGINFPILVVHAN